MDHFSGEVKIHAPFIPKVSVKMAMKMSFPALIFGIKGTSKLPHLGMVLALVMGCNSGKSTLGTANLEGNVTLDGKAINEGTLQFMPREKGQANPSMAQIVNGRYVAVGVPKGKVQVLLTALRKTGRMIKEYDETRPEVVSLIPEKYRSGIEINVTGDDPNKNFELKSK
jgi:hypothetical protein